MNKVMSREVCFYTYNVKYKVTSMDNGLLFEVKYIKGSKYGNAPVIGWEKEEDFSAKLNF